MSGRQPTNPSAGRSAARLARATSAASGKSRRFVTTVHVRGSRSGRAAVLDGILELTECASRDAPLDEVLAQLAERIAGWLGVEVCSMYLREPGDELVLRATHGFPQEAVGNVRMRVGEGLTGLAVECLRPVSVAAATEDARNKPFASLHEERFPALCALPLIDGGRAVGALVVQRRRARAFGAREVVLVAAMAPAVLFALEKARARRQAQIEAATVRPAGSRPVEITLRGSAAAPGRGLGVVAVRRARLTAPDGRAEDADAERGRLEEVFVEVAAEVAALDAWAQEKLAEPPSNPLAPEDLRLARAHLSAARFVLEDSRLRERALHHVRRAGVSAAAAIERVAREYARVLGDATDETLRERALELEALCGRMLQRLADDEAARALPLPGRVHVAGRLTVFEAIELARTHGIGVALSAPAAASPGIAVARALGLPVVCDLRALFRWASDGDRALVDGSAGIVLLNPSRADVAALRKARR